MATNQAGSTSQASADAIVAGPNAPDSPDAEDRRCNGLRRKLKREKGNLAGAFAVRKRSLIRANINDAKKRLRELGCRGL
jgi:hypothetical protein